MTADSRGTKAAFARAAEKVTTSHDGRVVPPQIGDQFVVRNRWIPHRLEGPRTVIRIGRRFFYLDGGIKYDMATDRVHPRGITIHPYDSSIHDAILEESDLVRWWLNIEGWMPSVNKLRAMKVAYDNVVEFEGEDR